MLLALAGCNAGDNPQTGQSGDSAAGVEVLYYFDGVISRDGEILFMPGDGREYLILNDNTGRQRYILETEMTYDPKRRTEYDEPVQTACAYRFYDLQGALQKELNIQLLGEVNNAVNYNFPMDGDLNKVRVMVNQVNVDGTFQVLDLDGNVLVSEQVLPPDASDEWSDYYVWLEMAENFIQVRCSFYKYDPEYDFRETAYFYDMSGQPLELERQYNYIYNIYDSFTNLLSDYYGGYYENEQGQSMVDLLDKNAGLLVGGLNEIHHSAEGLFVVVRGFERGLMDAQGNWIFKESVFDELED